MRIVTALLAGLLVAGALPATATALPPDPGGGTHQAAERSQRPRVTLTASPEWVKKGGLVTLRGQVKGASRGTKVTIFQKTKGKSSWNVEVVKRTSRKGRFTHREDVKSGDRTYKACVRRACDRVLVRMGRPPAVDTAVAVSGLSTSAVEAGASFDVAGSASPNLEGRTVEVQAYDGASSTWGAVGRASVRNGSWATSVVVTTAGRSVPIRAAFAGGTGLKPSTSTAASITVFGWYYLQDRYAVEGEWDGTGAYRISGVTYAYSVAEDTEYIGVDLQRACTRFAAVVGLDDTSDSDSRASVRILADTVERYSNTNLVLGTGYPVSIDITGALRLNVQPADVTSSPQIVFGDARVLCAF